MLLLRRNNESRKIHFSIQLLTKSSKNLIFYGPKVEKTGLLSHFLRFFGSFCLPRSAKGAPGTAQRPKKGYFEKRVFSDHLARNAFFMFFLPCVFRAENGVKKTSKIKKKAGK